jgi:hypothetical protein
MERRLDAKALDEIRIAPAPNSEWRNCIEAAHAGPLDSFFKMLKPTDYDDLVAFLRDKESFGVNDISVSLDGTTVAITMLDDTVLAPAPAFERLAARLLSAGIAGAEKSGHPATKSAEWRKTVDAAREIMRRLGVSVS